MGAVRWMVVVSCAACARPVVPRPPPPAGNVAFSDSRSVTALARGGDRLYAGTARGLVAWDIEGGARAAVPQALEAEPIRAIATPPGGDLFVATEGAVWRVAGGTIEPVPLPAEAGGPRALLVVGDDLWVGTELGVVLVRKDAARVLMPEAKVTAIVDAGGGAWVGTSNAGVAHLAAPDRVAYQVGKHGLRLVDVRAMAPHGEGGVLAAGADDRGALLAIFDGEKWQHLRPRGSAPGARAPDLLPIGAVRGETLLAVGGAIYALATPGEDEAPPPVRLESEDGGAPPPLARRPGAVPAGATVATAGEGGGIFFGTRFLGVVGADGRALRLRDVRQGLSRLHFGCLGARCFFAGGAGVAYLVEGDKLDPVVVNAARDTRVLAFASRDERLFALHAAADKPTLRASRESGGSFAPLPAELRVPKGEPEVAFASVSPTGELWAGVAWRAEGKLHPWGVAVWSADGKTITRHGSAAKEAGWKAGLPVPDDVRAALFFGEDVWLATGQGVCRIREGQVKRFTENEGLEGEDALDLAIVDRDIWTLTPGGLGRFDGRGWTFERGGGPVGAEARALARGAGAIVYAAGEHGVARTDGDDRSVLGRAAGLLDEDVSDVGVDAQGRLWALTADGVAVVRDPRPPRPRTAAPVEKRTHRAADAPEEKGD